MKYIPIKNSYGADFDIVSETTDRGFPYYRSAKRDDNVTLVQEMLAYEQNKEVREFIHKNYLTSHTVCANAVVWEKHPVFVERPERLFKEKVAHYWKVEGGTRYTKKGDDFELPSSGFYVPVPSGNGTSKYMLNHPITGMPFETVSDRSKAVTRWIPYFEQLWNLDKQKAREAAENEVSFFWRRELLNGHASVVRRVHYKVANGGPRDIDCDWPPSGMNYGVGVRLFRWAESEKIKSRAA